MTKFGEKLAKPEDETKATDSAEASVEASVDVVIYCSLPITNYGIGEYAFVNGYLTLPADQEAEFEAVLKSQPAIEQTRVSRLKEIKQSELAPAMIQGVSTTAQTLDAPSGQQQA